MRQHLEPNSDHPISIERKPSPVSVILAGETIVASDSHLELREASYPAAAYLPRENVDMTRLERSAHTTWCPFKGEASYYHIRTKDGTLIENAVWTYETPFPAVAEIKNALAVYSNKVDSIEIG